MLTEEAAIRKLAKGQAGCDTCCSTCWNYSAPVRRRRCLAFELFGNSVRHGGSGIPGEMVTVAVRARDGVVRNATGIREKPGPGQAIRGYGEWYPLVVGMFPGFPVG